MRRLVCFLWRHRWVESEHWFFDPVGGGYICTRCGDYAARVVNGRGIK